MIQVNSSWMVSRIALRICFYKLNSKNYDRIVSELERGHYHPNAKYTPFSEA